MLVGILGLNGIALEGRPRKFRNHETIQHSRLLQTRHSSASQLWSKELVRAVADVLRSSNFKCSLIHRTSDRVRSSHIKDWIRVKSVGLVQVVVTKIHASLMEVSKFVPLALVHICGDDDGGFGQLLPLHDLPGGGNIRIGGEVTG